MNFAIEGLTKSLAKDTHNFVIEVFRVSVVVSVYALVVQISPGSWKNLTQIF